MKAIIVLIAVFLFFFLTKPVFAVTVTIYDYPSTIFDEQFTITASISGAATGTNYLRIDIFKDGTTNYFGETFNNNDWYGGSTYSQYLPINIQTGVTWSGSVQGRIGSPTATQYDGTGSYKMRLRRYTSGGGYTSSEASNSAVLISISVPTSTPTPTETPTPINTPTPTKTPTPTLTPTPTSKPSPTKNPVSPTLVLGESTESGVILPANVEPSNKNVLISNESEKRSNNFLKILMFLGIVFTIPCAILGVRVIRAKLNKNE